MSLKISNKLTAKQRDILVKLEYVGKWDLTVEDASNIIDALFEERRLEYGEIQDIAGDYYDFPDGTQTYEQDNQDNQWK